MFSYRHAFHAGNHADVLKHLVLIAVLRHLTLKETPLTVVDTHAGAGLYRLDGDYARTSGEAEGGLLGLVDQGTGTSGIPTASPRLTPPAAAAALQDYLDMVASFNRHGAVRIYPGSPFIIQRLLRAQDRLKLFELHPTDAKNLAANVAQLDAGRQVAVFREDGFEQLKRFLPPPQKRGLVLMDPSYELKSDYARVNESLTNALSRFSTGTYMVWYPIIPRPEAHDLPRKLKALARRAGKPWVHATLAVSRTKRPSLQPGEPRRHGMTASGVFVINPPHTLSATLHEAIPQLASRLDPDKQDWTITS